MGGADLTVSTLDDPKALVICYVYTRTFVDGTLDEYSYNDGAERRLKQDIFGFHVRLELFSSTSGREFYHEPP